MLRELEIINYFYIAFVINKVDKKWEKNIYLYKFEMYVDFYGII